MMPNLLMRAWAFACFPSAIYQAAVCSAGSSGDAALHESLRRQYTSVRHHVKGLRTYLLRGVHGTIPFRRITSGQIGRVLAPLSSAPLFLSVTSNARAWQSGDLSGVANLHTLELEMECLIEISPNFLARCPNLIAVDISCLAQVDAIPASFLIGCQRLTTLDTRALACVRSIGPHFMEGCTELTHIDLTFLSSIEYIPWGFLSLCASLSEVDFTPLGHVSEVGSDFLSGCYNLVRVDLAFLARVENIPLSFLNDCYSLEEVDFRPLKAIKHVNDYFLSGCASLLRVDLEPFANVEVIGDHFLAGCTSLTQRDITPMKRLIQVGGYLLDGCEGLRLEVLQELQDRGVDIAE